MRTASKRLASAASGELPNNINELARKLGPVQLRPIASLKKYARNPRKHPERQLVGLEGSIRQFGFTMPGLIGEDDEIIAGEARLEAARRLGVTEVPVLVARGWSREQVKAYRLADNRLAEHATWDVEFLGAEILDIMSASDVPIEILGWGTAEIDVIVDHGKELNVEAVDPADADVAVPTDPVARAGDVWLAGDHRILCGSSLEEKNWERLMDGRTADMSFCDPPFNIPVARHVCGLGKVQHSEFAMASGEMSSPQFVQFLLAFLTLVAARCKDGAVIDICMDWRHLSELLEALAAADLTVLNLCVWNKTNGGMGSLYRSKHELIFIARKGKAPHRNNVELGRHGRYRTNVWDYAGVNSFSANRMKDLTDHPTVKPVAMVADAIRDVTAHGEAVIDAFLGSGTTLLAADRTRRVAYGMEIEPRFVDVAIRRWETMTGKEAVLEASGETFSQVAARQHGNGNGRDDAWATMRMTKIERPPPALQPPLFSESHPMSDENLRRKLSPVRVRKRPRVDPTTAERTPVHEEPIECLRPEAAPVVQQSASPRLTNTAAAKGPDYEIGYRRPPRRSQFKPGQSGNPKGRPKRSQSLNTIIRKHMLSVVQVKTARGLKRVPMIEALLLKALDSGSRGEFRTIEKLLAMYAAAVPETVEVSASPASLDAAALTAADHEILDLLRSEIATELEISAGSSNGHDRDEDHEDA